MGLRTRQAKFAGKLGQLLCKASDLKTPVFILEMYRSQETQAAYFARGVSKTLNSYHLKGLAVDLIFLDDVNDDYTVNYTPEQYRALGEYWESIGGVWGGRFGDDRETDKIEGWDSGHFQEGSGPAWDF